MLNRKSILVGFIVFHIAVLFSGNGLVNALDVPDDEGEVDLEEPQSDTDSAVVGKEDLDLEDEEIDDKSLKPSSDVDTTFLFTKPSGLGLELPAGKDVHFLVGFANRGSKDFIVESMDASFRYPLDFTFHIQNFSAITFNRVVKPDQEVSLYYAFYTSETFSSRPFGLTVNLFYRDMDGVQYLDAVFNETISIIEVDDSLDGETFFLYVFLAACAVLLIVAAQQFLVSFTNVKLNKALLFQRRKIASSQKIEMGTQNHHSDVDYDWLPKETLNELTRSPRRAQRQSPRKSPKQTNARQQHSSSKQSPPRQRKTKRSAGARDD